MNCECGKPATGIMFTKGVAADVPACKKCGTTKYKGWSSQSLNTAASAMGKMIRDRVKAGL